MDSKTGFAKLTEKERDVIKSYLSVELLFTPGEDFYTADDNAIYFRRHAVALICKLSRRVGPDALIPYLAMNHFDRFLCLCDAIIADADGYVSFDEVLYNAVACFTISAKMRIKDFSMDQFLISCYEVVNRRLSHLMVMKAEVLVLQVLNWEIRPVTPLTFLDYYYDYFKHFGGFKRRCINEIIVQAQGEHNFVQYYPSVIAISAFLAASKIAYPSLYRLIATPYIVPQTSSRAVQDRVIACVEEMVVLCDRLNIQIETTKSGIPSNSELNESQKNKGKEVMVAHSHEEEDDDEEKGTQSMWRFRDMSNMTKTCQALKISEGVEQENKKLDKAETSGARVEGIIRQPLEKGKAVVDEKMEGYVSEIAELEEPKSLMNFELKWPEDFSSIELPPQRENRSKSKGRIRRTIKKLTRTDGCKTG